MRVYFRYAFKETFSNLWRNRMMTVAAVLTVAVSLSLVGGLLARRVHEHDAARHRAGGGPPRDARLRADPFRRRAAGAPARAPAPAPVQGRDRARRRGHQRRP